MVDAGLVDELKGILSRGYSPNLNALNTVGYKEIMDYLDDKISLETAIADIQKHTRHFAKRQMTWFRKYEPRVWIDFDAMTAYEEILSRAKSAIINACPGQKEKNDF